MGSPLKDAASVRRTFLDFFAKKGHEEVASSRLVPDNDPTLLFANAGMNQFKDVFTGKAKRARSRATSSQKCVRAGGKHNDLENVGRTARHHTFFEMLGNFSFGDYFKEGAITFAHELLTEVYGLPVDRLVFTVHDSDHEARALWRKIAGVADDKVIALGDAENFWAMGETGPCGPCSEIHFFQGHDIPCAEETAGRACKGPACDCDRFIEIWNLVFMQFEQLADGSRTTLPRPSVDTGMGLERLCAVMNGFQSNYETDLLRPIIDAVAALSGKAFAPADYRNGSTSVSLRAIADHARATAFLIADGVFPEKTGREYVLRRIMRRAVYHGSLLGIDQPFFAGLTGKVVDAMADVYPELGERRRTIAEVTDQEEKKFRETLGRGIRILEDESQKLSGKIIPGALAFKLYDTYGFPMDLTRVIAGTQGFDVDEPGFEEKMTEQRRRGDFAGSGEAAVGAVFQQIAERTGATTFLGYETTRAHGQITALVALGDGPDAGSEIAAAKSGATVGFVCKTTPFYGESGGQVGDTGTARGPAGKLRITDVTRPLPGVFVHQAVVESGEVKVGDTLELEVDEGRRDDIRRNHSATHLLHRALHETLGDHVAQKGSLVGPDRLRFDFSHFEPLTIEQRRRIEDMVNDAIRRNLPTITEDLTIAEAKQSGAMAFFGEKYGDRVRVLTMGASKELCGGIHVSRTGDIGLFKILEESGVAQGVRRVEALTGGGALAFVQRQDDELSAAAEKLRGSPFDVAQRIDRLHADLRERDKEIAKLRAKLASGGGRDLASQAERRGGVSVLVADVPVSDPRTLRDTADGLKDKLNPGVIVLAGAEGEKLSLVCVVTKDAGERFHAGKILGELTRTIGGKGGGRPDMAQGGGPLPGDLPAILEGWRRTLADLATPSSS